MCEARRSVTHKKKLNRARCIEGGEDWPVVTGLVFVSSRGLRTGRPRVSGFKFTMKPIQMFEPNLGVMESFLLVHPLCIREHVATEIRTVHVCVLQHCTQQRLMRDLTAGCTRQST